MRRLRALARAKASGQSAPVTSGSAASTVPAVPATAFVAGPVRAWAPAGLGGVMIAGGVAVLALRDEPSVAWTAIGCGLVLAAWFASPRWRRSPVVWLDAGGFGARFLRDTHVAWRDVVAIRVARVRRHHVLVVERSETERARTPAPFLARYLALQARGADFALPLDGLDRSPAQIAAVVELVWRASARPPVGDAQHGGEPDQR